MATTAHRLSADAPCFDWLEQLLITLCSHLLCTPSVHTSLFTPSLHTFCSQLLINYTNEALQAIFNEIIFYPLILK